MHFNRPQSSLSIEWAETGVEIGKMIVKAKMTICSK